MTQFSELHDASSKPWTQLSSFKALVFLLLTQNCAGLPQLVGPSQPVLATVGDDALLSCRLEPAADASDMSVEWSRHDLDPPYIYVWWDKEELKSSKHPAYKGRTSLLLSKLEFGDVSLKLSKVKPSDKGKYRCFIPTLGQRCTVELVVGDFFMFQSSYISTIHGLAVSSTAAIILLILAVVLFVRTERQKRKMKTLETESQQLQQEKQKNEILKSRLKEWTETGRKLKTGIQNMNKKLDENNFDTDSGPTRGDRDQQEEFEKQKWMEAVGNLKTELQNMNKELELTGPITVEEVHEHCGYIRLKNISTEEIKLEGWELELQINNRKPDILIFDESRKLQAGGIICIGSPNWSSKYPDDVDLEWQELIHWWPEDNQQMYLISNNGEIFRLL